MTKGKGFDAELFFSALADRTRLRLLNLLRDGEVCVCFFAEILGTNNPKISRHLSYLKRASLVKGRRDGKWMHYSLQPIDNAEASKLLDATMKLFDADSEMIDDRERLKMFACALDQPITIKGRAKATAK